jgi:hypothetical protein
LDLTRLEAYAHLLTDLTRELVSTAKAHEAQTCSRLRAIPGGQILALILLEAIHDSTLVPWGQALPFNLAPDDERRNSQSSTAPSTSRLVRPMRLIGNGTVGCGSV